MKIGNPSRRSTISALLLMVFAFGVLSAFIFNDLNYYQKAPLLLAFVLACLLSSWFFRGFEELELNRRTGVIRTLSIPPLTWRKRWPGLQIADLRVVTPDYPSYDPEGLAMGASMKFLVNGRKAKFGIHLSAAEIRFVIEAIESWLGHPVADR